MNFVHSAITFTFLFLFSSIAQSQTIDFSGKVWKVNAENATIENYKGREAVLLTQGQIELPHANFTNGVIEYDIAFSEKRSFYGVRFRKQLNQHEEFYLRPHQSGNPDASQYTPVFNNVSGWQLYHGDGFSAAMHYDFNEWMHIKLVVLGNKAEVFYNDMSKPALVIHELKQKTKSGGLSLSAGMAPVHYANFSFKKDNNVKLAGEFKAPPTAPKGTIVKWQVSNSFDGNILENKTSLTKQDLKNLTWTPLETEASGLANLAQVQGVSQKINTTFVKATIHSETQTIRDLKLGYSDMAMVFLNGKALYFGQNKFQSRDYRYLGTVGFFDAVFLELNKGDNELIIAVAENFGGWGIKAQFRFPEGLTFK